ncbi:TPA: hypothetical protein EYP66_16195, partial [Candidatus Poribacteria bacterium]|nr:hypothetical protein [Candidatus Poribacteria bacterium]
MVKFCKEIFDIYDKYGINNYIKGMRNFYVPPNQILDNIILISGEEKHHVINVLRLELNEHVKIFDGFGNEYLAQLKHQNGDNVVAEILEHRQIP